MVVHQVSQSDSAPQMSDTAARPAAATEAAPEQTQGPVISSGDGVDAGEHMTQQMLNEGDIALGLTGIQSSAEIIHQMLNEAVSF